MTSSYATQRRIAQAIGSLLASSREAQMETQPPSPEEVQNLVTYLKDHNMDPVIVGSGAIVGHLNMVDAAHEFRPTTDLDMSVRNKPMPPPPYGWKRDPEAIGLDSWISPSNGFVDFLKSGQELPNGSTLPRVRPTTDSPENYPIADIESIFRMKLNSSRQKDLLDLTVLAKHRGIPLLDDLNEQQTDNLEYLNLILSSQSQS